MAQFRSRRSTNPAPAPATPQSRSRLVVLAVVATIGGALLAAVVAIFWVNPNDAMAYWLAGARIVAGQPVYTTGEAAFAPYAYHYSPPLAQLLAPFTVAVPPILYVIGYRAVQLLATWDLAGRRMLPMLALIAFLPVAVELRFENIHLLMALSIVCGLRRWPWLFAIGAIIKVSPGLGIVYLALRRRWREAIISCVVGITIVAVSYALDPNMWRDFLSAITDRAGVTGNSLIPLPYGVRAIAGLALTVAGGLLGRRRGELLLVGGITLANPNLALNGFAVLAAAVPIWRAGPAGIAEGSTRSPSADPAPVTA